MKILTFRSNNMLLEKKHVSAIPLGLKCETHIRHINEERAVHNEELYVIGRGEGRKNRSLKTYTLYFTM
jgi:hypothetical protein